jgi:hypothetical protein
MTKYQERLNFSISEDPEGIQMEITVLSDDQTEMRDIRDILADCIFRVNSLLAVRGKKP